MNEAIDSDKLYEKTGITLPHGRSAMGPTPEQWIAMSGIGSLFHNFVNPMGAPEEDKDKEIKESESKVSESPKSKRRIVYSINIKK